MYIGRKPDGTIYGVWSVKQPNDADHPGMEEVADDHPDLIAHLEKQAMPMANPRQAAIDAILAEMAKREDAPQAITEYMKARG